MAVHMPVEDKSDERESGLTSETTLDKQKFEEALAQMVVELRRSNAELERYAHKLEEANRLNELFTDIMRHDLLGPANVTRDFAKVLLGDLKEEAQRKIALRIKNNADKIIELIENASMYAKLGSVEELERERRDLSEILRAVMDNLKPMLEKKGMRLDYLPQGEYTVLVNPMIEAVFSNLLSNAIKYSPEGRNIEVNILDSHEDSSYRLYVKDWGYGIADEDKARVFTRFERADKTGVKGIGLGLAIVKRIVGLHQGKVWIEDNPEGGSVFFVEIPKFRNG